MFRWICACLARRERRRIEEEWLGVVVRLWYDWARSPEEPPACKL